MRQESDLEIRRDIHFFRVQRSKKRELIRVEYIDFGVWFLDRFILFWDSIDPSNRGFRESVWQSFAVLSLVSRFPTVKAQIIIHAVLSFFWGQFSPFLRFPLECVNLHVRFIIQCSYVWATGSQSNGPCKHAPILVQISSGFY
jgi:hypothetical protein